MTPPRTHGGRRAGSGRKPLEGGSVTACFSLRPADLTAVRAWATAHTCSSVSEALRQMIEAATAPQP